MRLPDQPRSEKCEMAQPGQQCPTAGLSRASPSLSQQPEADTEYSDPFDAQPQPPAPNNGYMEPYDARNISSGEHTSRGEGNVLLGGEGDQCPHPPQNSRVELSSFTIPHMRSRI